MYKNPFEHAGERHFHNQPGNRSRKIDESFDQIPRKTNYNDNEMTITAGTNTHDSTGTSREGRDRRPGVPTRTTFGFHIQVDLLTGSSRQLQLYLKKYGELLKII